MCLILQYCFFFANRYYLILTDADTHTHTTVLSRCGTRAAATAGSSRSSSRPCTEAEGAAACPPCAKTTVSHLLCGRVLCCPNVVVKPCSELSSIAFALYNDISLMKYLSSVSYYCRRQFPPQPAASEWLQPQTARRPRPQE